MAGAAALLLWEISMYRAVRASATRDQARPAGAILVMGAAEYDGNPSPVYQARLDHALILEEEGLAPLIITTGGSGGDPHFTEGGVGRDYLIQQGVAARAIIAETRSRTTFQAVRAASAIMNRLRIHTCITVSDGFHLYRTGVMLRAFGITSYGSPVPHSSIESDPYLRSIYSLRELAILTLWRLHIHV